MFCHIITAEHINGRLIQIHCVHCLQTGFVAISADTQIAAYKILDPYKEFEFLCRFLCIQILLIIGSDTSNREIESVPCNILINGRNLETEHHPFIVDLNGVSVEVLGTQFNAKAYDPAFHNMAHTDCRSIDSLTSEHLTGSFIDCLYETLMGYRFLIVLAEYRNDALSL